MKAIRPALLAVFVALPGVLPAAPRVVVDVAPVQSIVARIMQGAGVPDLMVPPGVSPHDYSLRPSRAAMLQDADVVFEVGPELLPWFGDTVAALAPDATTVVLTGTPGMQLMEFGQDHSDGHDEHGDHGEHHDRHAEHGEEGHDHAHAAGSIDPHVWLDPDNAVVIAGIAAEVLAEVDPENADLYAGNFDGFSKDIITLSNEIEKMVEPLHGKGFLVFHDAWGYFEHRFGLESAAWLSAGDGGRPGAGRIARVQELARSGEVSCIFSEPQFDAKLLEAMRDSGRLRTGVLDPVGFDLEPGPELYPVLMRRIAQSLAACLGADD